MCRYLTADQFLGITFINLVKQDLFSIELPEINRIEKKVDSLIREKIKQFYVQLKKIYIMLLILIMISFLLKITI
jgi:hypothetical protein|nr:MAG TPA: hypothetical protein [Caudoviricetes sp.]